MHNTCWFLSVIFLVFSACSKSSYKSKLYNDFADEKFRKIENTVTVNIIPTTYPLDWTQPRNLIFSLVKNQYLLPETKHFIGHVTTEVNCKTDNGWEREFIGQTSAEKGGFEKYLKQGYGFAILNRPQNNYDFPVLNVKGRLDYESEVFNDYTRFLQEDLMAVMTVKVDPTNCQKALGFIREYKEKTKQTKTAGNVYGFGADPMKFQGAGCAPLVQSVLNIAGAYEQAKAMDQTVFIPKELIGNPKKGKEVSLWDLALSNIDMSQKASDRVSFTFPDPQGLMDYFKQHKRSHENQFLFIDSTNGGRMISGLESTKVKL